MLTTTKTILFVSASLALTTAAFGSEASDARRSIENAYKRIDAATMRRDSRTLLAFMTPDYRATGAGKTLSKANMSRQLNALFSIAKTLRMKTSIQKFAFTGTKTTLVAQEITDITFVSQRNHKLKVVKGNSIFQAVWVKEKGHWLKQREIVLHQKVTVDGKVVEKVVVN